MPNKRVEVVRLFSLVNKMLMRNLRKSFEQVGLTIPQSLVIRTLIHAGEMKMSELSKHLNLTNSTVSGIVDRLEKQELVVRTRSQEDRRIVYVKATPKFAAIHEEMHKKAEASLASLLSAGTSDDIELILAGLQALKRLLPEGNEELDNVKDL